MKRCIHFQALGLILFSMLVLYLDKTAFVSGIGNTCPDWGVTNVYTDAACIKPAPADFNLSVNSYFSWLTRDCAPLYRPVWNKDVLNITTYAVRYCIGKYGFYYNYDCLPGGNNFNYRYDYCTCHKMSEVYGANYNFRSITGWENLYMVFERAGTKCPKINVFFGKWLKRNFDFTFAQNKQKLPEKKWKEKNAVYAPKYDPKNFSGSCYFTKATTFKDSQCKIEYKSTYIQNKLIKWVHGYDVQKKLIVSNGECVPWLDQSSEANAVYQQQNSKVLYIQTQCTDEYLQVNTFFDSSCNSSSLHAYVPRGLNSSEFANYLKLQEQHYEAPEYATLKKNNGNKDLSKGEQAQQLAADQQLWAFHQYITWIEKKQNNKYYWGVASGTSTTWEYDTKSIIEFDKNNFRIQRDICFQFDDHVWAKLDFKFED